MAEKKKPTTVKRTTKKPTVASKTTAKPKKVPTTAKKSAPSFLDWPQWKNIFTHSINCWKAVLWRYTLILITSVALQLLGVVLFSGVVVLLLGGVGGIESLVANLQIGTMPEGSVIGMIFLAFLVWIAYATVFGAMSKIAFLAVIRDNVKGKRHGVLHLIFKEGLQRTLSYLGLALRVFFYVTWPLFVAVLLVIAWSELRVPADWAGEVGPEAHPLELIMAVVLSLVVIFYMLYAGIRMLFALPLLIHTGKKAGETFTHMQKIMTGSWWYVGSMWMLFVALLYGVNALLGVASYLDPIILVDAVNPEDQVGVVDLLAFLMSLFIFGPITAAFQYYLMLQTAKNQSVKL